MRIAMSETALTELQNQIEAIQREAFAEGYAAAMQAVHELSSPSAPHKNVAAPNSNGRAEDQKRQPDLDKAAIPLRSSNPVRRSTAKRATVRATVTRTRRSQRSRAKRGSNALRIEQILKNTPRAVRQAEIRNALEKKGISLSFPSIRYALGQLEARRAAKQVGNSKTWRYSATA
jgi:hypothetical protein